MSEQDQVVDSINSTDEQEIEINLDDNEEVVSEGKTYTEEQFRQVLARAKKAEAEAKSYKAKPAQATQISNQSVDYRIDILKAQGVPDDEIAYLNKIAKVNDTDIIEARKDDLYIAYVAKKQADEKAQKAKLGASRGSGHLKKEKSINTPGLSDEEHKAMWREANGL